MKRWLIAVATLMAGMSFGGTYYVDCNAAAGGDGSFEAPFTHPQLAINAADGVEPTEIIVNDGTYPVFTAADWKAAGVDPAPAYSNRVMYIDKSNLYIHSANGREAVTLEGAYISKGSAPYNSHAIEIKGSLTNVRVRGFSVMYGFQTMAASSSTDRATSVGASSGLLDEMAIHGYHISGGSMVSLAGTAILSNSTFDAKTRADYNTNRGTPACIYMAGSAQLVDCRISDIKPYTGAMNGTPHFEAVYVTSADNLVRNCLITGNTNGREANQNAVGGGLHVAAAATIESCTITGNSVWGYGGGVYIAGSPTFRNCIIYGNTQLGTTGSGKDIYIKSGTPVFDHCCASDGLTAGVNGNTSSDPQLDANFVPAVTKSMVAGKGVPQDWMPTAKDLLGNDRLWTDGTVTMGAFESQGRDTSVVADFDVAGGVGTGRLPFTAVFGSTVSVTDEGTKYSWDFGDGATLPDSFNSAPTHVYEQSGQYDVTLTVSVPGREPVTVEKKGLIIAVGDTCYVKEGSEGIVPYDTWEKATSNIEAAVLLAPQRVLVTNGTYVTTKAAGLLLDKDIVVESVEGASVTTLDARQHKAPNYDSADWSFAKLTHPDAVFRGFTLLNGLCLSLSVSGGATVSNLVLRSHRGTYRTAAVSVSGGKVYDCDFDFTGAEITDQSYDSPKAVYVGGASVLDRCKVRNAKWNYPTWKEPIKVNAAAIHVGGTSAIRNSLICSNAFECSGGWLHGGGVYMSGSAVLDNCTLVGNSVKTNVVMTGANYGCKGGGVYCDSETCKVRNCIQWGNMVDGQPAPGDLVEDPRFAEEPPYALQKGSPCINKGVKLEWMTADSRDLYGNPRKVSYPDLGCCESDVRPGFILMVR